MGGFWGLAPANLDGLSSKQVPINLVLHLDSAGNHVQQHLCYSSFDFCVSR